MKITQLTKFLNRYRLYVNEENRCLPHIYWLPKLHKNPTKARFIILALKCFLKPLLASITAFFKILFHQIEDYSNQSQYFVEINTFWVILNH